MSAATGVLDAGRVWYRNFESWRDYAMASLVGTIAEPLLTFVAIGYGLGRFVEPIDGQPYIAFLAPGILAATAMNAAAFETTFGSFTRMSEQRTYEAIVMTPISVAEVVAGDILWAASKSALGGAVVLVIMIPLGLTQGPLAVLTIPLALGIGIMFGAMGMVWTAISPSYTFFNYFFTMVISVMYLFGGVFFPLEGLPQWAQWGAWCLPLTHAVEVVRGLSAGRLDWAMARDMAWLVAFTVPVFWLAVALVRRRLIQ